MQIRAEDMGFGTAVKHLFRHINDVDELRRNALVRDFFEPTGDLQSERAKLALLKRRNFRLAAECEIEALHAGLRQEALRSKAIVEGICFNGGAREYCRKTRLVASSVLPCASGRVPSHCAAVAKGQCSGKRLSGASRRSRSRVSTRSELLIDQGFSDQPFSFASRRASQRGNNDAAAGYLFSSLPQLSAERRYSSSPTEFEITERVERSPEAGEEESAEIAAPRLLARLDVGDRDG